MKHFILILGSIIAILLSACVATYIGGYEIGLYQVERPPKAKKNGEQKIYALKETGSRKTCYEDNKFSIVWKPSAKKFDFVITNKTAQSIQILWDTAALVDERGVRHKIIHRGITFKDRNNPHSPGIVKPMESYSDKIVSVDHLFENSTLVDGWFEVPMFPEQGESDLDFRHKAQPYIGKTVRVVLPLKIEENVYEYIFLFKIEDIISG